MVKPWLFALIVALVACGGSLGSQRHAHPEPPREAPRCPPDRRQAIDLTHRLHPEVPLGPSGVGFTKTRLVADDQGSQAYEYEMSGDVGTHVDAPAHLAQDKRSLHEIPVEELVLPAVVIDVRHKTRDDPDYVVGGNDIVDWEAIHGPVPIRSLVIVNTGWFERFREPDSYLNRDADGVMHFPGMGADAAALLVERDVVAVGIDTLSIDPGARRDLAAHRVLFEAERYQLENLANLDALPTLGATVVVGVLPVVDGTQAPARVIALVPEKADESEKEESP